ncbi:5-methyltetrahydrofolate--homocysteine methyltransferase [Lachnospiraceae bacterium XBB2008]|nr:5-methyltetrahydrofolate--homocysteine methyltransferase [Lachnospiraceae bacterium XBB2008]
MADIREYIQNHILYLDGGMGTLLQKRGLKPGELPERWNISHPEIITELQKSYYDAGSNVIYTNTFGANSLKFDDEELTAIIHGAIDVARAARDASTGTQEKFIALDIGPMGRLLAPYGDMPFDEAVEVYAKTVKIGAEYGVDLIFIETMNDSYDTKAALLAAKENSDLPVFVTNAYGEDGKLMTGASPAAMIAMLEGMHADAIGANCSLGPKQLKGVVEEYVKYASVPVILKPNAGLPRSVDGETVYDVFPDEFASLMDEFAQMGVRGLGGCCGTTPDYIRATVQKTAPKMAQYVSENPLTDKEITFISSYTHAVEFKDSPILIGERINPTGKKRFKQALRDEDIDYILGEGLRQQDAGAHVLDVNVGLPEIDEPKLLDRVTCELQAIIDLPLQIDTTDPVAMEAALRHYNGKALINSVNGKQEIMDVIFPLVAKYGGLVVALTLDEDGIPESAERRVEIARNIINEAAKYGIGKKDLLFDTLAMTISADTKAALATLKSLHVIRHELGCHTSLGVSNISFGLPARELVTSTFFALALEEGLSAAIMNPHSQEMMKVYFTYRALHDLDENCMDYIGFADSYVPAASSNVGGTVTGTAGQAGSAGQGGLAAGQGASGQGGPDPGAASGSSEGQVSPLKRAIIKGLKDQAANITKELIAGGRASLDIVNEEIIPALDTVGQGFEAKKMYLPQLLMSAEASQSAFEVIKADMLAHPGEQVSRGKFVIATVHGDIHDIGKNIVKLIMENYGFEVFDLGKDVPPEDVVAEAKRTGAPIVGLSALMTTTVPAMEETIKLLKEQLPDVKTVVGGAVLTQEYADAIGADFYAKDAMATVRYALDVVGD